jgi:hypothetical protein
MSSPAPAGMSGTSAMNLSGYAVSVQVTPEADGDVVCDMSCNGREVTVTYEDDGGVMVEIEALKHHFTAKALNKG